MVALRVGRLLRYASSNPAPFQQFGTFRLNEVRRSSAAMHGPFVDAIFELSGALSRSHQPLGAISASMIEGNMPISVRRATTSSSSNSSKPSSSGEDFNVMHPESARKLAEQLNFDITSMPCLPNSRIPYSRGAFSVTTPTKCILKSEYNGVSHSVMYQSLLSELRTLRGKKEKLKFFSEKGTRLRTATHLWHAQYRLDEPRTCFLCRAKRTARFECVLCGPSFCKQCFEIFHTQDSLRITTVVNNATQSAASSQAENEASQSTQPSAIPFNVNIEDGN